MCMRYQIYFHLKLLLYFTINPRTKNYIFFFAGNKKKEKNRRRKELRNADKVNTSVFQINKESNVTTFFKQHYLTKWLTG